MNDLQFRQQRIINRYRDNADFYLPGDLREDIAELKRFVIDWGANFAAIEQSEKLIHIKDGLGVLIGKVVLCINLVARMSRDMAELEQHVDVEIADCAKDVGKIGVVIESCRELQERAESARRRASEIGHSSEVFFQEGKWHALQDVVDVLVKRGLADRY